MWNNKKTMKGVIVSLGLMLCLAWFAASLIAWCPSGKRAPRARSPQPTPQPPAGGGPQVNPNPTPNPNNPPAGGNPPSTNPDLPPVTQPTGPNPGSNPVSGTPPAFDPGPAVTRPAYGPGLSPYFWDSLFYNPGATLPVWENWWIRNRLNYLQFKEPITWFQVSSNGETVPVATELRKQVFEALIDCLKNDKNPMVRANAALALGKSKDKNATDALKESMKNDKEFDVKNTAALALGILEEESVIDDIKNIVLDTKHGAEYKIISRAYAALSLGYFKKDNSAFIDTLKELFSPKNSKTDNEILCSALLTMGNLEDPSLISFITKIMNDYTRKIPVRAYAALALGRIKDPSALSELKKALNDKEKDIRASAAIAMGMIKSPDSKNDLLKVLTNDKDGTVKGYAAIALAKLGDKSVVPEFTRLLKKGDYHLQSLIPIALGLIDSQESLPMLREMLAKKNANTYSATILALGLLKDKESIPKLIKIVEKEQSDPIAWPYAIQALGLIGNQQDEKVVPVLEKAFKDALTRFDLATNAYNNLTVSLAMLGKRKEVLAELYKQLENEKLLPEIKWRILYGIAYIGDKGSLDPLVKFYNKNKTGDDYLRMYTVFALGYVLDKEKINPLYKITSDNNFGMWLRIIDHIIISKPD
jgi:HEAT repeat protein